MSPPDMTRIVLENEGSDSVSDVTTHALRTTVHGIDVIFPIISPHQGEIGRAIKRNMMINSPFVTYLAHVSNPEDFIENQGINKSQYEEFAITHSDKLINYSFHLHPSQRMNETLRDVIRDVQIDSKSQFLFEYEVDIEQDAGELMHQLEQAQEWLDDLGSDKILIPVIDMKMESEGLFLGKLERLSEKFWRINTVYQSPSQAPGNWAYLRAFLKNNKIWCHMDCVLNRYNGNKNSHRVGLYPFGISSCSISYSFGGGNSGSGPKIYRFNPDTHTYEMLKPPHEPSFAERDDIAWINSLNGEIEELRKMRLATINTLLYSEYIPSKRGTAEYLVSF